MFYSETCVFQLYWSYFSIYYEGEGGGGGRERAKIVIFVYGRQHPVCIATLTKPRSLRYLGYDAVNELKRTLCPFQKYFVN